MAEAGPTRRSFLAGLAAAALAVSLDPYELVSINGRRYSNRRLGLTLELPAGWQYSSIADFVALRARQVLLDELASEHHALKSPEELPVFVFEGPPGRGSRATPGVVLFDNPIIEEPTDEGQAHLTMLHRFARSYRDLEIMREPASTRLRSQAASISSWCYLHEVDGERHPRIVRTVLVFRGLRAHTFHLVDRRHDPLIPNATWDRFLSSIRYD